MSVPVVVVELISFAFGAEHLFDGLDAGREALEDAHKVGTCA